MTRVTTGYPSPRCFLRGAPWASRRGALLFVCLSAVPGVLAQLAPLDYRDAISREFSIFVGAEPDPPYRDISSRELSVVVGTPAVPARVTQLAVSATPTGESATLSWGGYNEWAQHDVVRYDIYLAGLAFTNVAGMTPYAHVSGETFSVSFSGLPSWQDRHFAVVPVDVAGGFDPIVNSAGAYVIDREAVSREFSVFVGTDAETPSRDLVSRELSRRR